MPRVVLELGGTGQVPNRQEVELMSSVERPEGEPSVTSTALRVG
ncbi:MAG: hypothetical protein RBU37_00290 [Myxococcota bacterium]|nr:hypothetical protein [Myxococcota bacterium]